MQLEHGHLLAHPSWLVVTVKSPLDWSRSTSETWNLYPGRRYVLNADQLDELKAADKLDTVSELTSLPHYRPLHVGSNLDNKSLLVERYRERGIGDHLFLTGPLKYLQQQAHGSLRVHLYASPHLGRLYDGNTALEHKTAFFGPLEYDAFTNYDHQFLVESVTEYVEERDQLNCYDAILKQMGADWASVPAEFKRPYMTINEIDEKTIGNLYKAIFDQSRMDLRATGYFVVAPFANSLTRTAPYGFWLKLIDKLRLIKPVIVIGKLGTVVADMAPTEFMRALDGMMPVVNLISNSLPVRSLCAVIAHAACVFCLDSGPLYIAQALSVPAVSAWGTHDPKCRIGYDQDYMKSAIWKQVACPRSPCYAYAGLPTHKCPQGELQTLCQPLAALVPDDMLAKWTAIESTLS